MADDLTNKDLLAYYEYLSSVLYDHKNANIDLDDLSDAEHRFFGEALMQFGNMAIETREFANSISRGELDCPPPSRGNELAAPLKSLHATLKHLTWQAKQISGGDYEQHVDFMGEFSDAFNEMVEQLASRRREMEDEAERNQAHLEELARANSIFEVITSNMEEWIVMLDRHTSQRLFTNHDAKNILASDLLDEQLYGILKEYINSLSKDDEPKREEFTLISDACLQHFEVTLYPIKWMDHDAVACVLLDVTETKEEYNRLEDAAYKDNMTGIYNRLYGMKLLEEYTVNHTPFVLVFIDMDMLKYVNDVFGHAEGDEYIKSVAEILREFSNHAEICRLGGDEFMVLIKESDLGEGDLDETFEALRRKLARTNIIDESGKPLYYRSISFGIMKISESNELSTSDILAMADEKMYEYKKAHKQERRV